jgi:hypothetical protein
LVLELPHTPHRSCWVPDTWGAGLDQLPYPQPVRDSFKKFRTDMLALAAEKNQEQFDAIPLTKYLKAYAPEIKQWWDAYGLSNYGAKAADTSTMVALLEFKDMAHFAESDSRVTLPGGNGAFAKKLADTLLANYTDDEIEAILAHERHGSVSGGQRQALPTAPQSTGQAGGVE